MWKIKTISDKLMNLAKEISRQNDTSDNWFILTMYHKVQTEKDDLKEKKELLHFQAEFTENIKEPELAGSKIKLVLISISPTRGFSK